MIDLRRLRAEPDAMKAAIARRRVETDDLDVLLDLDRRQRDVTGRRDDVRGRIKRVSKDVAAAKGAGDGGRVDALTAESRDLGAEEKRLDAEAEALAAEVRELLLRIPNPPADDAPDGASAADNVIVRHHGYEPDGYADHQRVPHWEIGPALGILDLERGAKLSGSMFPLFRGAGAALVRALCQLAIDLNSDAFEEVRPPTLVRGDTMVATGHLPKYADDVYHVTRDDLWAIPTAEVPLTSIGRDEILDEADLPVRLLAHTSCFRREAGAAGRETRGLLRVHEFDKVEILAYATPEQAPALLDELVGRAERALQELGLPYRVVDICTGDMNLAHHRSFDLEVYAPGADQWLEVSSISWFSDYQARRANIRYRPSGGGPTAVVHTLNGSALAVPRVWAALVETCRQPDGSIAVPSALQPYLRGMTTIRR
jgi:seryl-tRNA synthetase